MNWDAVGAIGDAVGGIGVIVSLIYLAIQTRKNTAAIQAASLHDVNKSFAEISLAISMDSEMTELLQKVVSEGQAELTETERGRFGFFATSFLRRAESMWFQSEQGTLQQESWRGLEATLRVLIQSSEGRQWWASTSDRFNSEFQRFVSDRLL